MIRPIGDPGAASATELGRDIDAIEGGRVSDGGRVNEGGRAIDDIEGGRFIDDIEGGRVIDDIEGGRFIDDIEGGRAIDDIEGGRFIDANESVRCIDVGRAANAANDERDAERERASEGGICGFHLPDTTRFDTDRGIDARFVTGGGAAGTLVSPS